MCFASTTSGDRLVTKDPSLKSVNTTTMEIVSKGNLQPVSRPASSEKRGKGSKRLPTGSSLELLPPEVELPSSSIDTCESEDCDEDEYDEYDEYDDYYSDEVLISQVENDVSVEDVDAIVLARHATSGEELLTDEEEQERDSTREDSSVGNLVGTGQEEDCVTPVVEEMDPKIRKGLEKIKKLDQVLSEKIQKEKEVKTKRHFLEKMWREQTQQLEEMREREGHGKMELGVAHLLALGAPDDNTTIQMDDDKFESVTPVFPTQPLPNEATSIDKEAKGRNSKEIHTPSEDCFSDILDDKRSERVRKKRKNSKAKQKGQNFIKRNISLAADAGNIIPMTEEEKKRLEELLNEGVDQFVVDGPTENHTSDICVPSGAGFLPDQQSLEALTEIDHKLQALVPVDELDMLSEQGSWTPITSREVYSQATEGDEKSFDDVDIGERVLREEKEMRQIKQRLLAIEEDLKNLQKIPDEDSDVTLSREMLAKLIDDSSRTTSRSTTISATVLSNLSTPRHYSEFTPLDEIEEATFDDNFSSRTTSRNTATSVEGLSNCFTPTESLDSPESTDENSAVIQ